VAKGLAAAGGGVEKTLKRQEETIRAALRVIYVTRPMPSHPVAYHPRVPGSDAEKVRRAFMEMAAAPEGRELLGKIPMNNPISTVFSDYAPMLDWGLEAFWVEKE
jgi:phosphonate transport system substrate-binding protein